MTMDPASQILYYIAMQYPYYEEPWGSIIAYHVVSRRQFTLANTGKAADLSLDVDNG